MKIDLSRIIVLGLLLMGAASLAFGVPTDDAPEIDPAVAAMPLAMLAGAALIVRSWMHRRRQ